MSLSVISNIASAISQTGAAATSEVAEGLPGEFAALLSEQTLAAMMSLAGTEAGKNDHRDAGQERGKVRAEESNQAFDPAALVAMISPSQTPPPAIAMPALAKDEAQEISLEKRLLSGIPAQVAGKAPDHSAAPEFPPGLMRVDKEASAGNIAADAANIAASSETPGETINFNANLSTAMQQRGGGSEHHAAVSAPLHSDVWPQQFGEKVVWLAKNDQQTAQINITPPQLGPVQITLNLSGDQATVAFASPHAEVRQAIESSMPQLKEMLSAAGISLGDTNVGANMAQQNPNNPFPSPNKNQSALENAILPANDNAPNTGIAQVLHKGRGLVDLFA
jgi:flagellar hook-length control protein FliK